MRTLSTDFKRGGGGGITDQYNETDSTNCHIAKQASLQVAVVDAADAVSLVPYPSPPLLCHDVILHVLPKLVLL